MSITRVKICGITSESDARAAESAGADAIGLVFYEKSPRAVTIEQAACIVKAVGPFVTVAGLFVNASAEHIQHVLRQVPLQVLQFHGDEEDAFCSQFGLCWYKAIRMHPDRDPVAEVSRFPSASACLFDAWRADKYGGTGEVFDWHRLTGIAEATTKPVILAGGLTPDNVAEAIAHVAPYAVDVSGGVERAPGVKDATMIQRFIDNIR